jgi:MFS family permease
MTDVSPNRIDLPALSDAKRRRGMIFLALAVAMIGFAMSVQTGLNDNFLVEQLHLEGNQKGILEAFRESCGILAFAVLALLAGFREPVIASGMLVLVGIGLAGYSLVHTFPAVIVASMVWSQGLHVWMPLPGSMMLSLAEPEKTGRRLGQMQAAGALGAGIGLLAALGLMALHVSMRHVFVLGGVAAVLGAVACMGIPRDIKAPGQPLVFRRKYFTYYLLNFLEGWRKQTALAFSGFLLVKVYETPVKVMLLLWLIIQAVNWLTAPLVGRLIDRFGERRMLVIYYATMIVIFLGYIGLHVKWQLWTIFVLDNSFFVMAMALTTYVRRIAPPEDHTATLGMGVAANHISSVTMPLVGGFLWFTLGYRYAFLAGIVAAVVSIFVAMLAPGMRRK